MRVAAAEAAAQAAGGGGRGGGGDSGSSATGKRGGGGGSARNGDDDGGRGSGSGNDSSGGVDEFDDGTENWHRSASNAAMEALDGERGRGLSDAIRENVAASFDLGGGGGEDEEEDYEEDEEEVAYSRDGRSMEEAERRRLREKAFAIVLYASGDR